MPDSNRPGDVPPDLPPEYAEAYRRGYERAYQGPDGEEERTSRLDSLDFAFKPVPSSETQSRPLHRESERKPAWLVPALLGGLALMLILSAYGLGQVFSHQVSGANTATPPNGVDIGGSGSASPSPSPRESEKPKQKKYAGRTQAAEIGGATVSCQSPSGVDAGGLRVSYDPSNLYDGDMSTAWRCDGDGVGQKVTIALSGEIEIGEVGLVPGYAKTDPRSGADRYAENNRITRVRWTFSDGTSVIERFNGSADVRRLHSMRIPVTTADSVVIEILGTTSGPRNTTAISEVRIGEVG